MTLALGCNTRRITYRWNARFFHTSIYNVSAGAKSEEDENPNNVVANLGPVHPLVVGPWLHIARQAVSSR